MVLSSARIGRGSWRYYQDSVARGACEYYAEGGNAPGRWWGAGLPELGLAPGSRVQERELEALFARGLHPGTGAALGRAWRSDAVTGHDLTFSAPKSVSALWALADDATGRHVRAAHDAAVQAALGFMQAHASFSRRGRDGVEQIGSAGFAGALFEHTTSRTGDPQLHTHALVLNKVRCVDGVWRTIDGYEVFHHKKAAGALYQAALRAELATRLGVVFGPVSEHGQAEIAGIPDELLAAWSTRTAAIMAEAVPTIAEAEASLGREVSAAERARIVKTAVLATRPPKDPHVPVEGLRERWRKQAAALGWTPDRLGQVLRRATTAAAVPGRGAESVTDSVTTAHPPASAPVRWAGDSVTDSLAAATSQVSAAPAAGPAVEVAAGVLAEAVTAVGRSGAVWSAADLTVQIAARIPTAGPGAPTDAAGAAAMLQAWTAHALTVAEAGAVPLGQDPSGVTARASDARYASTETVALEAGIIEAVLDGLRNPRRLPAAVLAAATGDGLSDEQQVAAVRLIATHDLVTVMVAPAGAGKTTVLGAAVAGWTAAGQRVLVLGPSARAASELAAATGRPGATVAKFLTQQAHLDQHTNTGSTRPPREARSGVEERRLRRGDVVLVDEASMLATADLANLTARATAVGARLVLVGDPAQIGAVRAPGGMLEHLTTLIPQRVVELDELHRFAHSWEAAATLALRNGDPAVLDVYRDHDRIHPAASGDDAADAVFERWHTAVADGTDALMLARGWADVIALNIRARAAAIATGEVSGPVLLEVTARTASSRGRPEARDYRAGDVLMAKKNTRDLAVGGEPVRNGDRFQVLSATPDGRGLVVTDLAGRGRTVLPAAYVARHVEYGWAATIDAAQGTTTGIAVTLARPGLDREHLYVAMTRGRLENHLCTAPETPAVDAGPHHYHGTQATAAITAADVGAAQDNPALSPEVRAEAFSQLARALATTGKERAAHSLLAPAVDTEREAMFHAAENARPAPNLPREHERNAQRLQQAQEERDRLNAHLGTLAAERDEVAARLADTPFWSRGRRHDLTTALDAAGQALEETTVRLAAAEDAVRAVVVVVDADTNQRDADAAETRAARRERWSQRADLADRDPNLVDAAAPRPRQVSPSAPVPTPRRSRAARRDRDAPER
ncbi:MAG: MobF family relaxase [Candidatus Nanopelagicales bacterium]